MTMKFGVMVPQGWRMDLVDFPDPVEAYEAMTSVAQEAEFLGFDFLSGFMTTSIRYPFLHRKSHLNVG